MVDILDSQGEFGEKYFSKLSRVPFYHDKFKNEFNLILKLLPPIREDKILDMGCGRGPLGLFLSNATHCSTVFSDISPMPKDYLKGCEFVQCSMTDTPFADGSFDKIYSLSVISHIEDADKAVKEMYRISRGDILITTNNKYAVLLYKIAGLFGLAPKLQYDKTVKKLYRKATLKNLLKRNGWKIKFFQYEGEYATVKLPFNFLKTRLLIVASK